MAVFMEFDKVLKPLKPTKPKKRELVELIGIEPTTSSLRTTRSSN